MRNACTVSAPKETQLIFQTIGLTLKTGQPLHLYRLNDEDFDSLRHHLINAAQYRRLSDSSAPFVLWSAEAFRRGYDGGQYTWSFLTDQLQLNINLQDLYDITKRGLGWFGRRVAESDGGVTFYIKTLAAEGGLPESLLSETSGRHRRLVRGLMADVNKVGMGAPRDLLEQLAARRAADLPLGFRTSEFRDLLLEFCLKLLDLRAGIPSSVPVEARLAWLDANHPEWKQSLPLRIESSAAHSLLLDAVTQDVDANRQEIVSRLLFKVGDSWISKVGIAQTSEIPEWLLELEDNRVQSLRMLPDTALSQSAPGLILSADRDASARIWDVRRESAGRRGAFTMPLDRPIAFRLVAEGRTVGKFIPPGGQAVTCNDIPTIWAAAEKDDRGDVRSLKKIGASSLRCRAPFLWVLVGDEKARFDGLDAHQEGLVDALTLWRVTGKGRVYGNGWSLALTTSADEDSTDRIVAHGTTVQGLRDVNGMEIFHGLPGFYSQSAEGAGRSLTKKNLCWRSTGDRNWKRGLPDAGTAMGLHQIGWRDDDGATRAFISVRILPKPMQISLVDKRQGILQFTASGLPIGTSVSLAGEVSGLSNPDGNLSLTLGAAAANLGRIPIHLRPPEGAGRAFDVTLPRPGTQGFFIDSGDRILLDDLTLDLSMLGGWRAAIPPNIAGELQVRLMGNNSAQQPLVLKIQNETALSAFLPRFRYLMAIGGPDSELRLRLLVGADQSCRITLRRYLREGQWDGSALTLPGAEMEVDPEGMTARCVNLMAPGLNCEVENLLPGQAIETQLPEHGGPWMIFASDSHGLVRPPRPLIKKLLNEAEQAPSFSDSFAKAGDLLRRSDRVRVFGEILRDLTDPHNFGDLCLFEMLIDDLGNDESLSSFDSVVALSEAPALAALLLLRGKTDVLATRMELESVSPFSWTTLPIDAWMKALSCQKLLLSDQLMRANISERDARNFADDALRSRLRDVLDRRPEISGQIFLAASNCDLLPTWTELGSVPQGLSNAKKALMDAAQRAISRHEAARQPFDLRSDYAPEDFGKFHEPMRGLLDAPLVAAEYVLGCRSQTPDAQTAVALLHYRIHDPDYFETAMPAAIALIHQGMNT